MTQHACTITRPVRFPGPTAEAIENRATHNFDDDADGRCFSCDCRPAHAAASYPCGAYVPSETVTF